MSAQITIDQNSLLSVVHRLDVIIGKMKSQTFTAGQRVATELEQYAKDNHPWQNRTFETERTTEAIADWNGDYVEIVLTTGTPYTKFLELYMGGRFTWLAPAMQAMAPRMLEILIEEITLGGMSRSDIGGVVRSFFGDK